MGHLTYLALLLAAPVAMVGYRTFGEGIAPVIDTLRTHVFNDALWPDFDAPALDLAFASYRRRERSFGRTSEQLVHPDGHTFGPSS